MTSDNGLLSNTDPEFDWGLRLRVTVPDPVAGYFDRPDFIERLLSDEHSIAVLRAPGGYGKTTLLAAYCRRLDEGGIPAAWLQIRASDTRSSIESHLFFSLRQAGIDVPEPGSDAWSTACDRIELLLSVIAAHAEPCVLTLDNLERLTDPGSVGMFNMLLRDAPPNLRVAMACRELPFSLDVAEPLLQERVNMLTAAELRFSPKETAAFLGRHLARQELTAIDRQFEGWPIALALHRKSSHGSMSGKGDSSNLLGNWIESRLLEHLSTDQRDFLLDAGLLAHLDPVLLDEVLDGNDSRYRLQAMPELDGLIRPLPGNGPGTAMLHPLLRRHCKARRIRETPERFQAIHHRAALTLERRGETAAAVRHAAEAGDPELLGRLIEDAGGTRLWARRLAPPFEEVIALLTYDVIKRWPRLALTYCFVLIFTDRIAEARRLYELAAASSDGLTRNPTGDIRELLIDHYVIEMVFFVVGCTPVSSVELQSAVAGACAITQEDDLEPGTRGALNFWLCVYDNRRARFDEAFVHAEQARQLIDDNRFLYLSLHIDIQLGNIAMARGHVQEAETCYASVLRSAHAHFPNDPMFRILGDTLLRELQFERNRLSLPIAAGMHLRDNLTRPGNTFATLASECVIIAEVTQYTAGVDEALAVLNEMTEYARRSKRQTLGRYLAALRVAMLVSAGRVSEAERVWRAEALPAGDAGCLDLQALEWREMEMFACARLRLYAVSDAFEAGREFAERLLRVAMDHHLVRTAMRAYAISMTLEWRAGNMDAACAHLNSFLHHYTSADYARAIIREGDASREVLEFLLDSHPDGPVQSAAIDLLKMVAGDNESDAVVRFTDRELVVLKLLPDLQDEQIAMELSITREGVRYHLRRIFAKLGARDRREAVRRARSIGLLQQ